MLQSNKSTKLRLVFQVGCKAPTKTSSPNTISCSSLSHTVYPNTWSFIVPIPYFPHHYLVALNVEIQLRHPQAQLITRPQTCRAWEEAKRIFPPSVVKKNSFETAMYVLYALNTGGLA